MDDPRISKLIIVGLLGVMLGVGLGRAFGTRETVVIDTGQLAQAVRSLSTPLNSKSPPQDFLLSSDGTTLWVLETPGMATVWRLEGNTIRQLTDHPYQIYKP